MIDKLHRDDLAKEQRPGAELHGSLGSKDPQGAHEDKEAGDRLAKVSLDNASTNAKGKPPNAKDQAEVMQMFREVNGDPAPATADGKTHAKSDAKANGVGKPPSAADSAEVMNDFREVNGDVGRGKPPNAKDQAEVMEMFREVNGDPAPATHAKSDAKGNGVGKPPSAADSAEVMNDFREVNGDVGRGKPPNAKDQAEVMEMFREVNGDPAPVTGGKPKTDANPNAVGKPPSAKDQAEVMEMFREVNGDVGRGAPPNAKDQAEVMQMFREVNGDPAPVTGAKPKTEANPNAVGRPPSAKDQAEVMEMFREVNGDPAPAAAVAKTNPNPNAVGKPPSAKDQAEVMQMFREVNGDPAMPDIAKTPTPGGPVPIPYPNVNAVGKPPSAKDQAEVMEMFREVNGDPAPVTAAKPKTDANPNAVGKPPSAKDQAEVMEMFREVNGDVGRGKPPGAKDRAEVMEMFREVNGDASTATRAQIGGALTAQAHVDPTQASFGAGSDVAGFAVHMQGDQLAHEATHVQQQRAGRLERAAGHLDHEHDPAKRLAKVAIEDAELSLETKQPQLKKKQDGDAKQTDGKQADGAKAKDAGKPDEAKHDAKDGEQVADKSHDNDAQPNDRLQRAAADAQEEVKAHGANAMVDGHGTGLAGDVHANQKVDGHGTGLALDEKHAPNQKVDGHGTGLLIDDQHAKHPEHLQKIDGHGTGVLIDDKHAHGPNQKVDGHGTGLDIDPMPNQQHPQELQHADHTDEIVDADGEKHPYNPASGKAPTPKAKPNAGGGFHKPPPKPELPPPPQTANQQALNAFIEKARADRDAAKKSVQHQQLAKSAAISVDANVIAQQVKKNNDTKLAAIRKDADAKKAKAAEEAAAKKTQEGPVTLESLKAKLEATATEDKAKLKTEFDAKSAELKTRLDSQKQVLEKQTQDQIANYKKEQDKKAKDAQKSWDDQKAALTKTRNSVVDEIKKNVAADQAKLTKEMETGGKLWTAANARMDEIERTWKANRKTTEDNGNQKATDLENTANGQARTERQKGEAAAAAVKATYDQKINDASFVEQFSIRREAAAAAGAAAAPFETRARDLETKGKLDGKAMRASTKTQCDKIEDDGVRAKKAVSDTTANQVKAIETKITDLAKIADGRIKKAEDDLKTKLAAGETKLTETLKGSEDKINKLKAEGDAKIAKLETESQAKLQKDYDAAVTAVDKRVEVARKQLATGNEKNLKALEKMVDQTCKAIDKTVSDTEKKFDHTVMDADKQASQFVLQQLQKIKAEAEKALAAIDKNYEDALKMVDDAVAATHKQIEDAAKGKMLEIEVHVGTLMKDCGDSSRYDAARSQLEYYIKNKLPIPAGYGEAAPPPSTEAKKEDQKSGEGKPGDKKEAKPEDKKEEPKVELGEERKKLEADEEKQKKLLDPNDLSPEGIQAKVDEQIKKGQKQTSVGATEDAKQTLKTSMADATDALTKTFNTKSAELEKLKAGDTEMLKQVHDQQHHEEEGKKAAADIEKAMQHKNWYGGSSPDKKAILKSLEGKTKEEIEAMEEELARQNPPIHLRDFINKEMSGSEKEEANVRMTGDPIAGDIAALKGSAGHQLTGNEKLAGAIIMGPTGLLLMAANGDQNLGADKARIQEILEKYKNDPEKLKQFAKAYEDQTGRPLGELLHMTGNDSLAKDLAAKDPDILPKKDEGSKEDIQKKANADVDKMLLDPANKGKLHQPESDKAYADLNEALNGFHLDSTRGENVAKALEGKSPEDIAYIKAKYKAETGHDLDRDLEGKLTGSALAGAKAELRGDKTQIAVNKILGSEEASWTPWTVDDDKMKAALKELKDPAERRAVLEAYEKRTGRKLQDVIAEKMTGNDKTIAKAYADGDELKARTAELDEATNGGWMNGMHKAIAERTGLNTEPFTRGLVNAMVSPVGAVAMAVAGDDAKLTLPGGYVIESGAIHKVDSDKIFEIMESTPNPADRERLKLLYKQQTGRELDDDMKQNLVGPSGDQSKLDAYKALDDGRIDDYYAAKMDDSVSGLNDTKAFHKCLEGKSEAERKRIIEAFNKRHGNDPNAFSNVVNDQFGEGSMDAKKANLLATSKDDPVTGAVKLPDEFVLQYAQDSFWNRTAKSIDGATAIFDKYPMLYAIPIVGQEAAELKAASYFMRGWGVDNDAIKEVLKGKSKTEIEELKKKYPELEKDLNYCLSGRDAFEVNLMLKDGEPKTDEEKIKRKLALYEFDRGEQGAWIPGLNNVSNGLTDLISPSGQMMDVEAERLKAQLKIIQAGGQLDPLSQKKLASSLAVMDASTTNFIAAREEMTGAIATAVGAVVGAVVTVLTGGVAGAILAALATGMATVATKVVMLGQSYGRNEMGVDLAMTAVQMATAGMGGGLSKLSEGFLTQVLNGAIGAAASNFAQTAITSKDAHDLLGLLAQASKSGMVGLLSGGANAAATAGIANAMGKLSEKAFGPNAPLTGIMMKGFVSGAGGAIAGQFAEAMVDPDTMAGNWDVVFAKLARGAAEAGFQNGLTEVASTHHERMEQVHERAQKAVEEVQKKNGSNRNVEEEKAAFAKAMGEGYEAVIRDQEAAAKQKKAQEQAGTGPNPDQVQKQLEQHPPAQNEEAKPVHEEPAKNAKDEKIGNKPVEEIKQHMDEVAATKPAEEQRTQKLEEKLPANDEKPAKTLEMDKPVAPAEQHAKTEEMPAATAKTEEMPTASATAKTEEMPAATAKTEEMPAAGTGDAKTKTLEMAAAQDAKTLEMEGKNPQDAADKAKEIKEAANAQAKKEEQLPPLQTEGVQGVEKGAAADKLQETLKEARKGEAQRAEQAVEVHTRRTEQMIDEHGNPMTWNGRPHGYGIESRFSAQRVTTESGQVFTEITIKIHLEGASAMHGAQGPLRPEQVANEAHFAKLKADAVAGVDHHYNNPELKMPNGDRLRVKLEFVENPADAHLQVKVRAGEGRADQKNWYVDSSGTVHAHELGHQLGLLDEYHDAGTSTPAKDRATPASVGVHDDGSLMGDFFNEHRTWDPARGQYVGPSDISKAQIKQRHLDQIHGDIVRAQETRAAGASALDRLEKMNGPTETTKSHDVDPKAQSVQEQPKGVQEQPKAATEQTGANKNAPDQNPAAPLQQGEKPRMTPKELAAEAQRRANEDRANGITPEQRAKFTEIDQLATLATTPADFEFIRDLEAQAGRPVSERFSHNDAEAALQAKAKQSENLGTDHEAAMADARKQGARKSAEHDQAVDELTTEANTSIKKKDQEVTQRVTDQAKDAPVVNGRKEITVDAAVCLGMGGAGAAGAHGDMPVGHDSNTARTDRIGIEDATKPELWSQLGHKQMGQEADAISYGRDGVRTSDIAEHGSAMPAKASDLALQVAAQRDSSGVGTVGSQGPVGPLEFRKVVTAEGKTVLEVGVPTRVQTGVDAQGHPIIETVLIKTTQGVDISTGMGPARELSTKDAGERKAQLTPEAAEQLKKGRTVTENGVQKEVGPAMLSGEAALAMEATAFKGERVLGIGGGPTSEWAAEHAMTGGAKSVEIAGQMPRPKSGPLAAELNHVEAQIRAHVERNEPVPPELTKRHHEIVTEHVNNQRERIAELDRKVSDGSLSGRAKEKAQQERARIAGEIDPFLGSRVDRNHSTLNSDQISHVQADVIRVKPITEEGGHPAIEVTYADGTTRIVDRVIPSIGANPDAPGGIHAILKNAPPEMKLVPVISEGRVVGLESEPAGISISGAAMVGTLGTNMPPELMKRIPPEMRDAVVASVIDHAYRDGVSAGSRGIVPGIENVGSNVQLTIEAIKKIPKEQRSQELKDFLERYKTRRDMDFGGEQRFPELQPKSGTTQDRVAKLTELEHQMESPIAEERARAQAENERLKNDPEWQDALRVKAEAAQAQQPPPVELPRSPGDPVKEGLVKQVGDPVKVDELLKKVPNASDLDTLLKTIPLAELEPLIAGVKKPEHLALMIEHLGADNAGKILRKWLSDGKFDKISTFVENLANGSIRLAEKSPLGRDAIMIDSNTAIALAKNADPTLRPTMHDGEIARVAAIDALPAGTELRVGNVTIGEVGDKVALKGVPMDAVRESADYKKVMAKLESESLGRAKGFADRALVADAFFAKTEPGVTPKLMTADQNVVKKLATIAGIDVNKEGGFEGLVKKYGSSGFSVTIEGRTLRIVPVL